MAAFSTNLLRTFNQPAARAAISRSLVCLTLCALATAYPIRAQESAALKLTKTIPLPGVKGRFDHFAIDVKGRRLFVAALGNNTLEAVDIAAGNHLKSITGLHKPTGVLYLPEFNQLFIANGDDRSLKIFDGSTYKLIRFIGSLDDADNMRYDEKAKLVYVGFGDGALAIIDPVKQERVGEIKLKGHPESFQLETNGNRIFINVPDARQIAIADREKRKVIDEWQYKDYGGNFPMALAETKSRLFVAFRKPSRLLAFDISSGKIFDDVVISDDADDLFYDAKRKRIYVSCGEGFIDILEWTPGQGYRPQPKIVTSPGARTSFFCPERDEFYLAVQHRGQQDAEIRTYLLQK